LIRSEDDGQTWGEVVLDDQFSGPDSAFNHIYSFGHRYMRQPSQQASQIAGGDSLYILAGCGIGFWRLTLADSFDEIVSKELYRLEDIEDPENFIVAGRMVVDIETATWLTGDPEVEEVDTVYEWALATWETAAEGVSSILLGRNFGEFWTATFVGDTAFDLHYTDSAIWAATEDGLLRYNRNAGSWIEVIIIDLNEEVINDTIAMAVTFNDYDSVIWLGTEHGIASSYNAVFWDADTVNLDSSVFDHNIRSLSSDSAGLSGNFVTALEVQYYDNQRAVWAAGNSTGITGESNGVNVSLDGGKTWTIAINSISAWNFAFNGADAYVASSQGLLKSSDFGETWDTLEIVDLINNTEIYPETDFYGIGIANGEIWVASDDGIGKTSDNGQTWTVFRNFAEIPEEAQASVYASPLPSSPYSSPGGLVRFHYKFENSGNVTIEVFDFAMNLVATPVNNVFRDGGTQNDMDVWDMRNDNGDFVATGPYYFKVVNSSGGEEWGKILVIP